MPDVTTRAWAALLPFERVGGLDVGAPLRARLGRRGRIPWEVWAEVCGRAELAIGPEAMVQAGRALVDRSVLGAAAAVGADLDPRSLYRTGLLAVAPGLFRPLRFMVGEGSAGPLEVGVEIPGDRSDSPAFLRMVEGALRALVGLSRASAGVDAQVEAHLEERRGQYLVGLPVARWSRRRTWSGVRSGGSDLREVARRAEDITRVLLTVLPDLVLRMHRDGTLVDFRAGADHHPNAPILRALVGSSLRNLVALRPDVTRGLYAAGMERVADALASGQERAYEVRSTLLGSERHYDCRIFPVGPDEVVVLVRDDTDRRADEVRQTITDRMATLGTLAAGVAHELNNPLTYMIANASLALEEVERGFGGAPMDLGPLRQTLSDARLGGERARRIVGDLGLFARGTTEDRRPTELGAVLESVVALTASEVGGRARLRLDPVGRVDADRSRLGQVFANLVLHAAQTAGVTRIEVRATVDPDGWPVVTVSDDGPGIEPDELPRVFQPFWGSSGLRLAIGHRVVTELGGTITVDSAPGRGSAFRIRLPPSANEPVREPSPKPAPERVGRILVVDDEPLVARAICRTLAGHDLTVVSSGEEAVDRLKKQPFDLILCDLTLGGIGGIEVREAARLLDPDLADRFLFVSGGAQTEAARALVAAEPERCLSKPFSPVELRARVQSALARPPH